MPSYSVDGYIGKVADNGGNPLLPVSALEGGYPAFVQLIRDTAAPSLIAMSIIPVMVGAEGLAISPSPEATTHILWSNVATRNAGKAVAGARGGPGHERINAWRVAYGNAKTVEIKVGTLDAANKALSAYMVAYAHSVSDIATVATTPEATTPEATTPDDSGLPASAIANTARKSRK